MYENICEFSVLNRCLWTTSKEKESNTQTCSLYTMFTMCRCVYSIRFSFLLYFSYNFSWFAFAYYCDYEMVTAEMWKYKYECVNGTPICKFASILSDVYVHAQWNHVKWWKTDHISFGMLLPINFVNAECLMIMYFVLQFTYTILIMYTVCILYTHVTHSIGV